MKRIIMILTMLSALLIGAEPVSSYSDIDHILTEFGQKQLDLGLTIKIQEIVSKVLVV